jgi:hypothetical protein
MVFVVIHQIAWEAKEREMKEGFIGSFYKNQIMELLCLCLETAYDFGRRHIVVSY